MVALESLVSHSERWVVPEIGFISSPDTIGQTESNLQAVVQAIFQFWKKSPFVLRLGSLPTSTLMTEDMAGVFCFGDILDSRFQRSVIVLKIEFFYKIIFSQVQQRAYIQAASLFKQFQIFLNCPTVLLIMLFEYFAIQDFSLYSLCYQARGMAPILLNNKGEDGE
ncbi:hypothetical protein K470DRAFT_140596 [Piedraia hortae CBS 480.64]|uniref:Uncharacterized protein n=1 Tax=Piedraia hortae CBS 480.64 TaxID=1314780 RepID=A0A6A7C6G0_9PEZI|nr:hypothetical protein K470DRAFT_140596 [Piedraia hortae CBS 480.64]